MCKEVGLCLFWKWWNGDSEKLHTYPKTTQIIRDLISSQIGALTGIRACPPSLWKKTTAQQTQRTIIFNLEIPSLAKSGTVFIYNSCSKKQRDHGLEQSNFSAWATAPSCGAFMSAQWRLQDVGVTFLLHARLIAAAAISRRQTALHILHSEIPRLIRGLL